MSPLRVPCPACRGAGYIHPAPTGVPWLRCAPCDGIGTAWAPGAPAFDCQQAIGEFAPGSIVTLGNGDRARILWHTPRPKKKQTPEVTFVGEIDEFTDREHHRPIAVPSCVGVLEVHRAAAAGDLDAHAGERNIDYSDPVHRQVAGRLI